MNSPKSPIPPSTAPKKSSKPFLNWRGPIVITLLVLLGIFLIWGVKLAVFIFKMMSTPTQSSVVTTVVAQTQRWPRQLNAVAELKSTNGALLKAEVAGPIREILVSPNQEVKKGDLLLSIDADAERASAKFASLSYERAKELRAQNVNTQNDLDIAEANYAQARAALDKKEIRAPFDGVVGIPQVVLGQYITAGHPLIAVESRKTIYADFAVPQGRLPQILVGSPVELTVDAHPGIVFAGTLEGVDTRVDEQTLTVIARATFPNPEGKLLSGMFGSLTLQLKDIDEGLAIPATAVIYSAYGNAVYVTGLGTNPKTKKEELQATQSFIKIIAAQGDWVLVSGLKEGDEIVTTGHMKLHNGSAIKVDNSQLLPAEKNPTLQES